MLHGKLYRDLLPKAVSFLIESDNLIVKIDHYKREKNCLYSHPFEQPFFSLRYLKQFNSAHGQAIQKELKQFDRNSCLIFSSDSFNNVRLSILHPTANQLRP